MTAVEAEIERALCSRGVTKAAFVGYSLGAYHALALAVRGVVQATKVVCLAGLASLGPKDREAYLGGAQLIRSGVDLRQLMLQHMVSPGFAARNPELPQQVLSWPEATSLENLANETEATGHCEDLLPTLSRIGTLVLARVGALDLAAPKERRQEIVRAVRSGTLEVVPEVGHALTIEDLPGTIESVKRFLLSSIPEQPRSGIVQSGPILVDNAYVLREKLGQGGMAAVYRASRLIDGHDVALKLLGEAGLVETPEHSSPELHVRPHLAREFQTLSSLHHPNVIRVESYGFDQTLGPYYTMDLLESAQTILEAAEGQPLRQKVLLLAQLLRAVQYLHRRGVLYRDFADSLSGGIAGS